MFIHEVALIEVKMCHVKEHCDSLNWCHDTRNLNSPYIPIKILNFYVCRTFDHKTLKSISID